MHRVQQLTLQFFAKVGLRSVVWNQTHEPLLTPQGQIHIPAEEVTDMSWLAGQAEFYSDRFQFEGFYKVLAWMHHIHSSESRATWVTWYELLWSFQMFTGIPGVQKTSQTQWARLPSMDYDTAAACRSFGYFMTSMIRQAFPEFSSTHTKPENYRWQHWAMCIPLQWNSRNKEAIHQWLHKQLGPKQFTNLTRDTALLPPASGSLPAPLPPVVSNPVGLRRYFRPQVAAASQ